MNDKLKKEYYKRYQQLIKFYGQDELHKRLQWYIARVIKRNKCSFDKAVYAAIDIACKMTEFTNIKPNTRTTDGGKRLKQDDFFADISELLKDNADASGIKSDDGFTIKREE